MSKCQIEFSELDQDMTTGPKMSGKIGSAISKSANRILRSRLR